MTFLTPVAFFIFNRPDTTSRVFKEIRQARPQRLMVVADGPRNGVAGDIENCAAARAVIDGVDWPCEVLRNFSDVNMGCKKRVSSGLDWVFGIVESAIILEDDCLPNQSFFPFCEQLLDFYRDDARIMMIGGSNFLLDQLKIAESYCFSRYFSIWGWATWRRAWKNYDITMRDWPLLKEQRHLNSFYFQGFMRRMISNMFDGAHKNQINAWGIQWSYSCLFKNGLSIVPRVNLISNIGLVGTHTSSDISNNNLPTFSLDTSRIVHPSLVFPTTAYDPVFFKKKFRHGLVFCLRRIIRLLTRIIFHRGRRAYVIEKMRVVFKELVFHKLMKER